MGYMQKICMQQNGDLGLMTVHSGVMVTFLWVLKNANWNSHGYHIMRKGPLQHAQIEKIPICLCSDVFFHK